MTEDLQECRPTGNPEKQGRSGIGMPAMLHLEDFGDIIFAAYGEWPYHVGSSLMGTTWRDVDVRLILDDEKYASMGFGKPGEEHENARWVAHVKAFSLLGRQMTGLPIDFQIQQQTYANEHFGHKEGQHRCRSSLIMGALRRQNWTK